MYADRFNHALEGLKKITDELIGNVWVDQGDHVPGMCISEQNHHIEVLPVDRSDQHYRLLIQVRLSKEVEAALIVLDWKAYNSLDGDGIVELKTSPQVTVAHIMLASAAVLNYYAHASATQHEENPEVKLLTKH